jgi:hypothetical protein
MDQIHPETARRISRLAGVTGLVFLVMAFMSQNPPFYSDAGNAKMLGWVHAHHTALYVEGVRTSVMMVLMVGFLAVLMWRAGVRDPLRSWIWSLLGASMAIDMVWTSLYYALAYADQHHIGDSGVLALATVTEQATFTDGFLLGFAIVVVCAAALRARTMPAPVAWLGVVLGVVKVVGPPLQVALNHTSEGITGPVGTVLLVFWVLAASLTLLIRPGAPRAGVDTAETRLQTAGNTVR